MFDLIAHDLGCDQSFLSHWNVAGPGRNDDNHALAINGAVLAKNHNLSRFAVLSLTYPPFHRSKMQWFSPGCKNVAAMFCQVLKNFCHLFRRLAAREDHFRHARAEPSMMVNFGKAKVLERHVA